MKEEKYKVWCKNKKEWERNNVALLPNGDLYDLDNRRTLLRQTHDILFYTGIKDKENNEVYEDDIVEGLVMVQNDLMTVRGLIKFIHGRFVIAEHNCSLYKFSNALGNESNEITKIGNKHENPELLNK